MPTLINEIWNNRSLVFLLAFNDVKLRYRNSVLGFFWSILEPIMMLGVLYLVFTNIFNNSIENYPIYLFLGIIIWYTFSRATSMGQTSLLDKAGIVTKIYFRREIVVLSSCLTSFIMMCFEFAAFGIFVVVLQFTPPLTILLLPLVLIDLFVLTLGISLLLSVLTVHFRDLKFIWQIALQVGFFTVPIFYQFSILPEQVKQILELNPMASLIDTAHRLAIYGTFPTLNESLHIVIFTLIIFIVGFVIFRVKNKNIVELI